jgi:OOP family OmpA-OmpF porin
MLTAIGDFVNDSFEPKKTGELRAFAAGDLTVLVECGPQANIAAVVRGQPPETLPTKLQTTLERIHLQWSNPLATFDGDCAPFTTTQPLLEECVETVLATDQPSRKTGFRRFAWVIPALLIVAGISWWATRSTRRWNAAIARLDDEAGIAVIQSGRQQGKWFVRGLRDPLATNPAVILASRGVDTTDVVAHWEPYVSTEPALLLARAKRVLAPPGGVTLALRSDTLVARGRAPAYWVVRAEGLAPALAGVGAVDLTSVSAGLPADMEAPVADIERVRVLFAAGSDVLDANAAAALTTIATSYKQLVTAAAGDRYDVALQVIGRADPTGAESDNLALSRRRASAVHDRLTTFGIAASQLHIDAAGSNDPIPADSPAERARLNRSASFVVTAKPLGSPSGSERVR